MNVREKNIVENKVDNYNELLYDNGPVTVSEYVSNKYNDIHQQLYEDALQRFLDEHPEYDSDSYRFMELKNKHYYEPSHIYVMQQISPFKRTKVYLGDYWNIYEYNNRNDFSYIKISDDETIQNSQIVDIDYVRGKATLYDKLSDIRFDVGIKRIDGDVRIDSEYTLAETFGELIRQNQQSQ